MEFFAHSLEGKPTDQWQPLEEHLNNVAELAARLARPFGGENWARTAGRWHDLGKGTLAWQAYLRKANEIVDEFSKCYDGHPNHADLGAHHLHRLSKEAGKLLAYCVSGHHAGLPNWDDSARAALKSRVNMDFPDVHITMDAPDFPPTLPFKIVPERMGFSLQFFVRMLFSCLVDADYLDTEQALDKHRAQCRTRSAQLGNLHETFWHNFNLLRQNPAKSLSFVNQHRESVLSDCLYAAEQEGGLFSLTVPTGGGKTLASFAFALEHAIKTGKKRIIYVIPFTSIIEQNAAVFKEMLGKEVILEHHCNFITDDADWKMRLATENWDATIIVTTNVQFFNSFYANKTSKCRKLHNIVNSVVVFDEVQAIPIEKLKPCLEVIKELSLNYGVTSVLCTATQPAIVQTNSFKTGLEGVREIVSDVPSLFMALKRTEERFIGELNIQDLAVRLSDHEQVLCIVNTRQQALDIFEALSDDEGSIHLSALMHPAHRSRQLAEIRRRLSHELPCRVVSTQIIEAGVDVDFPCVFRAMSGIDSIAQAAGRCNRNGLHKSPCPVFVFEFPESLECAFFKQAAQSAKKLFDRFPGGFTSPDCVSAFFEDYFWKNEQRMDVEGTLDCCAKAQGGNIQFKELAKFKMIKSATVPIIIALEKQALSLVEALAYVEHAGGILRKLQQFVVQIYPYQFDQIRDWLEEPILGVWVLCVDNLYSETTGLKCSPPEGTAFFG